MRAFILCSLIGLSQQRCRLKTTCVNSRISALIIGWMQHDRTVSSFPDGDFPKLRIEKTFFVPHAVVLLGHRIGRYIPPETPLGSGLPVGVFHDALIRQELLSNIEQSRKELLSATAGRYSRS
jgi:hypothetical protein